MDKRSEKTKLLVILGCCCILAAAALYAHNIWVSARAARQSDELLSLMKNSASAAAGETERRDPVLDASGASSGEGNAAALGVGGYDVIGTLEADAIRIKLPVISEWSYKNLRAAPCRYTGAPDTQMVLLAHNYEGHFGRLKELKKGDTVTFTDVKRRLFRYRVIRTETIDGNNMNGILSGKDWNLTLFTCTYSGAKRVVVRCCRF